MEDEIFDFTLSANYMYLSLSESHILYKMYSCVQIIIYRIVPKISPLRK